MTGKDRDWYKVDRWHITERRPAFLLRDRDCLTCGFRHHMTAPGFPVLARNRIGVKQNHGKWEISNSRLWLGQCVLMAALAITIIQNNWSGTMGAGSHNLF